MALDTVQLRQAPWALWITADYSGGKNAQMVSIHSIRCQNTSTETIRAKVVTGYGPTTVQHTMIVGPGEDKRLPEVDGAAPFPILVAGNTPGIAVEPV